MKKEKHMTDLRSKDIQKETLQHDFFLRVANYINCRLHENLFIEVVLTQTV